MLPAVAEQRAPPAVSAAAETELGAPAAASDAMQRVELIPAQFQT